MDPNAVIFDISSDEEPAFEEDRVLDDDYNWLTQLLETVDKEKDDDPDEVVVVGEYNPPKPKSKSKSLKPTKVVDDDDDCVVLDCDPDNPVAVADDAASDGDDVLVVGQKGQIACRDYPHSRHLCIEFPFNSTSHERHCHLCHCYVCDSLAPCAYWGTGVSSYGHCHATDKVEMWKTQRELFRLGNDGSLPVSKLPDTPLPVAVPQPNPVAPLNNLQLAPNSVQQNHMSRPAMIRPCSSPARGAIPNVISQGRSQQSGCVQGRNGLLHRVISKHGFGMRNNMARRDRSPNISNLGQQFGSSNTMFKRPGFVGGSLAMSQSMHGSSNKMNYTHASKYTRDVVPLSTSRENVATPQGVLPNTTLDSYAYQSSSQLNMGNVVNTVSSRPELYSQPVSRPNDGVDYQLGSQGQNTTDSEFLDFDLSWIDNLNHSNQQTSVENIKLHDAGSFNEPATAKPFNAPFNVSESTLFHYKDHEYERWLGNQAVPVASEGCVPSDLNGFSPEPSAIDTGMLYFDFETSWHGLTHA